MEENMNVLGDFVILTDIEKRYVAVTSNTATTLHLKLIGC